MANFDMTLTLTPSDSLENRRLIEIGPYSLEPGGRNYKGFYNVFVTKIHLNGSLELLTPLEREIDFCHQMVKDIAIIEIESTLHDAYLITTHLKTGTWPTLAAIGE